jgi:hypothetical protein
MFISPVGLFLNLQALDFRKAFWQGAICWCIPWRSSPLCWYRPSFWAGSGKGQATAQCHCPWIPGLCWRLQSHKVTQNQEGAFRHPLLPQMLAWSWFWLLVDAPYSLQDERTKRLSIVAEWLSKGTTTNATISLKNYNRTKDFPLSSPPFWLHWTSKGTFLVLFHSALFLLSSKDLS